MSKPKEKVYADPLLFNASHIAIVHTYLSSTAFLLALFLACLLHYKKVVKNEVTGWPQEWWPSVSATIGDWYPERNVFQIIIALTSGPRIALVCIQYYLQRSPTSYLPTLVFISGLVRTLACGGWVYITSSDDHDVHDFLMVLYIVCNIPWMVVGGVCTPKQSLKTKRWRNIIAAAFFMSIIPMVYFFVLHKVHRVPGAYTRYAFFEWALIFFDVLYDFLAEIDFREAGLQIALGYSPSFQAQNGEIVVATEMTLTESDALARGDVNPIPRDDSVSSETPSPKPNYHIPPEWRAPVSFLADVYLSYVFWTVFTSLAPTLFYFSVWELGIAGHELALISTLSPILLSIQPFLVWARSREGLATLHLLSFSGLTAYVLEKPIHRLFVVAGATACAVLRQVVDWSGDGVGYHGVVTGLGLVVSSLSKHANHGNNPVWPFLNGNSGGYNKTGITLATLALYEFGTRPSIPHNSASEKRGFKAPEDSTTRTPWLPSAVSLGSLIFSLHSLLSDSSTLIAWSWTGYNQGRPNGPVPNLHGSLTLVAQSFGLLLPLALGPSTTALAHPAWLLYGLASVYTMYSDKDWLGFAGGLNFAVFLMSIIPGVLSRAANTGTVWKTYFTAWLVVCMFDLASVWTVAYAFVPGGLYLRERTDLVLLSQMVALAFYFDWPLTRMRSGSPIPLSGSTASCTRTLLAIVSVLSVLVSLYRLPCSLPRPFKSGPRMLTAGIWTLHFGIDNKGRDSQWGVRDLIRDMQLDVVGLLETDLHRVVFGNRDLTRVVADELGYNIDIGPGPNKHTWGAALLSKFPIINSTHHLLPSPAGELAPAIEAVLDVYGTEVTVVVAHNGQEEDPLDRELQSIELARIMAKSYPQPVIFLGYVVTHPKSKRPAPYEYLVTDGRMHDIDQADMDRWCEYILYRGLYRTAYARLSRGFVTDTELQVGQFVLPKHGHPVENDTEEARYLRSWKESMPEEHWFPMEYYGNEKEGGVNGHFYHVFNTPLYYKIPDGAVL